MDVDAVIRSLEELAPASLAEPFDEGRIGLIIEGRRDAGTVCCALDATPRVIDQATREGAGLLVVHHTPLWNPVTRIGGYSVRLLRPILQAEMNLYVMHTNFDRAPGGVNDTLASILSLTDRDPLGGGLIGSCDLTPDEISYRIECPVRVWGRVDRIKQLALAGGSGFDPEWLVLAKERGADAFLSAELKHSAYIASPITCIEATHYALESPAMMALARRMGWIYIEEPPEITWHG